MSPDEKPLGVVAEPRRWSFDILGSAEVKECMLDAARISHVIMLQ